MHCCSSVPMHPYMLTNQVKYISLNSFLYTELAQYTDGNPALGVCNLTDCMFIISAAGGFAPNASCMYPLSGTDK